MVDLQCCVQFLVYIKVIQFMCVYIYTHAHPHTHTYIFFFIFFSIVVYYRILNIVPCAIQKDLVVYLFYIYQFVVYLLYILFCIYWLVSTNPDSHSVPLLCSLRLGNHKSVVQVCESVAVLQISSLVSYFRIHIQVVLGGICLSLSDLHHLV